MSTCVLSRDSSVRRRSLAALLACGLFSACGSSSAVRTQLLAPPTMAQGRSMLVVPLENLSPFPEAGAIVSDLVVDELRAWQGYDLLDRRRIEALVRDGELAMPLRWGAPEALRFARRLGADLVLTGTVVEYGYLRESGDPGETAAFALVLRVLSADTGRVVWSGTVSGARGGELGAGRPPLTEVSRDALGRAFARMHGAISHWRNSAEGQGAL